MVAGGGLANKQHVYVANLSGLASLRETAAWQSERESFTRRRKRRKSESSMSMSMREEKLRVPPSLKLRRDRCWLKV